MMLVIWKIIKIRDDLKASGNESDVTEGNEVTESKV